MTEIQEEAIIDLLQAQVDELNDSSLRLADCPIVIKEDGSVSHQIVWVSPEGEEYHEGTAYLTPEQTNSI